MSIFCVRAEETDDPAPLSIEELFAELLLSYATQTKEGAQKQESGVDAQHRERECGCGCEWHHPSRELFRHAGVRFDEAVVEC
jgi:hypothetical protein